MMDTDILERLRQHGERIAKLERALVEMGKRQARNEQRIRELEAALGDATAGRPVVVAWGQN